MTATLTAPASTRNELDGTVTAGPVTVHITHPGPEQAQLTIIAPTLTDQPIVLRHHTDLAVALHYADHPLSRDLSLEAVLTLIVRGVLTVGVDQVLAASDAERAAVRRMLAGRRTRRPDARDRFWSTRRAQLCADLAYRVLYLGNRVRFTGRAALGVRG
jgi:hypothetical protein